MRKTLGKIIQKVGAFVGGTRAGGDGNWSPFLSSGSLLSAGSITDWQRTIEESSRLFPVISKIADDMACNRWRVAEEIEDGKFRAVLQENPLSLWMQRPWIGKTYGGGTFYSLLYLTAGWLASVGEAFWVITKRDAQGNPVDVIPVPPSWVASTPPEMRKAFFSIVIPDNLEQASCMVPASEVIWIRKPSFSGRYRGRGKAQCLSDEVTQEELASKFQTYYFRNNARPDMVIFVEGIEEHPNMVNILRKQWDEIHAGVVNSHRPAFIPASGRVEQMSVSLKDMGLIEIRNFHRDQVWQAYQIPPEVMGAVENSNRATIEAAMHIYQVNVLKPLCEFIFQELRRWFVPQFRVPANYVLLYDDPVQESNEFKLAKSIQLWQVGLTTRDESRIDQGKDPVGGVIGPCYSVPLAAAELRPDGTYNSPKEQIDNAKPKKAKPAE